MVRVGGSFLQRVTITPLTPTVGPKRVQEGQPVEIHASQLIPYIETEHSAGWDWTEEAAEGA